ncbi:hypothetical protein GCM10011316_39080 [Roseibium aquae]|uniref:WG repeat protein n=1 Tax=Roseibium aquae TaxID=1323746 RepID=A0A916TNH6_9HYPH|nr:hypothetical protein [Roseibium aquae]GGB63411.1 hypothetical protein GCM10011316_39080 [Roseibium aquae]
MGLKRINVLAAAAILSASQISAAVAQANLASCPALGAYPAEELASFREMREPFTIPPHFRNVMAYDGDHVAVSTLGGGMICDEAVWMSNFAEPEFFRSDRFLGYAWVGADAYGYRVFDRAGSGGMVDTGLRPAFSDGGRRMAGLNASDAGAGALEGFAIWDIGATGLADIHFAGSHDVGFSAVPIVDPRVERFMGQDCVLVTAFLQSEIEAANFDPDRVERRSLIARDAENWIIREGQPDECRG